MALIVPITRILPSGDLKLTTTLLSLTLGQTTYNVTQGHFQPAADNSLVTLTHILYFTGNENTSALKYKTSGHLILFCIHKQMSLQLK